MRSNFFTFGKNVRITGHFLQIFNNVNIYVYIIILHDDCGIIKKFLFKSSKIAMELPMEKSFIKL